MGTRTIDIGCGPNKTPGAFGVDHHPYEGVDQVIDLNDHPWPLEADSFDRVLCHHLIEHIEDPVAFMKDVHRIAREGTECTFVTPHFSSIHSWSDPTHRWHLSTRWYRPFLPGSYLAAQAGAFEHVSSDLSFSKSTRAWRSRLMVRMLGVSRWERHYAFRRPARNITTVLRVVKTGGEG